MNSRQFGLLEMSAIREMANIGLGHATTALATATGHSFNMEIPNVETISLEEVPMMLGNPEELSVGIFMPIEGDMAGMTAFLFPWTSAQHLWRLLLGGAPQSVEDVSDLEASAMLEIGNIVSSNFLNAIADMAGLKMLATPPGVSIDLAYTIASSIVVEDEMSDVVALALETKIYDMEDTDVTGFFLCIPTLEGVNLLFNKLGISEAA